MPLPFFAALLLAFLACLGPARAEPQFPPLAGRVTDAANLLPADVKARLEAKLQQFEAETQHQFVVATVPDLQGYDIADYGYQLGRAWKIGSTERNDGILLIVAPNERRVRIEVGYGLEGELPDALGSVIVQSQILPRFKGGDMPAGIEAGVDAVIDQLKLPPDQARANAQRALAAERSHAKREKPGIGTALVILFIVFFFILPLMSRAGRRGSRGGVPVIFWGGGGGGWGGGGSGSGWGGGGWGGGSGDGGGFSGGGGSFGGGGASGGW